VSVSGFTGNLLDVNVSMTLSHTYPDDIDILLESPSGQQMILLSDCGGTNDFINTAIVFNDSASANASDAGAIPAGSYKPTNITSPDPFAAPGPGSFTAPVGSASTPLSIFNGTNPNGTWKLYVVDDLSGDFGSIASWSLKIIGPVPNDPPVITGSSSVCQGQNGVAYSIPVVAGVTGYTWTLPSGASIASGSNTNSITVNFSGSAASGNIVVTPYNTCGNSTASTPFGVTVNNSVTAGVSVAAAPAGAICSGTNVVFTATPSNGGTTPVYQWKKNGTVVGTNSTSYSNNALVNGDQITCTMTSNATCVTGSPAVASITMTVNPNVTAAVNVAAVPSGAICSGTNVVFTATPSNGGTTPVYQWKKNGTVVGTNSTSYSNNALVNGDQVTCTMTSNAACVTGSPATSSAIIMTVNTCTVTLNLKVYIEGFYDGNALMKPVLYNNSLSADPTASDSITVELRSSSSPYGLVSSIKGLLHKNGNATIVFPGNAITMGSSYFIAILHRNSLETWSKTAVLINSSSISFDFTTP
ncbi:MAG: proprotein convertase P-domain-containing protein, partial [Bacteroidetes bacterium]|nr:proprotein convertase P-domain-containing protein [Bacteroidota bacterium]